MLVTTSLGDAALYQQIPPPPEVEPGVTTGDAPAQEDPPVEKVEVIHYEELEVSLTLPATNEEALLKEQLAAHPEGYVIVVFKSTHLLYLAKEGEVLEGVTVKKSELDKKLFGFLKGSPEDEVTFDFPVPVALSPDPEPRTRRYDKRTPEGEYVICNKNDRASTRFTVGLEISYPNMEDARRARKEGRLRKKDYGRIEYSHRKGRCPPYDTCLGGYIKIHGPSDATLREWRKTPMKECSPFHPEECRDLPLNEFLRRDNPYIGVFADEDWTFGCVAAELTTLFYLYNTVPVGTTIVIYP